MAKASSSSRLPGWIWFATPALMIAFIGFLMYLRTVPAGSDLDSVRRDTGRILQEGIDRAKNEVSDGAVKPAYDFYRLLEEQKVESPYADSKYKSTPKVVPIDPNDPIELAARNQAIAAGRVAATPATAPAATPASAPTTKPTPIQQPIAQPAQSAQQLASISRAAAPVAPAAAPKAPAAAPAAPAPAASGESFLVQVSSFRTSADAENQRANLLLIGLSAWTSSSVVNGATWYRVYVGPFSDRNSAARAQSTLASHGINAIVVKK
ncbi:SPOR domain-containing protein [Parathalassolituus penaei]|uniref:SPOR domain-containing protein n=1 Tax=Parathalassolituus penaei TaxID=2997323 RepID=A0A9X3EIL0_9GAMM|nr:SPOR domain-containing protein [Parathalassolituus penaei]MCY0967375.1 SPOR domain-containing protein [Parathalassolituus penaei]